MADLTPQLPLLPSLTCKWGSYDQVDPEVGKQVIDTIATALGSGGGKAIITRRIAIEKAREVFPQIENVEELEKQLDEQDEANARRELDAATAQIEATARARGTGANAPPAPGSQGSGGGRPPSGKVNAG